MALAATLPLHSPCRDRRLAHFVPFLRLDVSSANPIPLAGKSKGGVGGGGF